MATDAEGLQETPKIVVTHLKFLKAVKNSDTTVCI